MKVELNEQEMYERRVVGTCGDVPQPAHHLARQHHPQRGHPGPGEGSARLDQPAWQWVIDGYTLVFAGLLLTTAASATASVVAAP